MEFFHKIDTPELLVADLQNLITIDKLNDLCASISSVTPVGPDKADIYCIWGGFALIRDEIRFGVRFSLLNCPHALAWTITYHEQDHHNHIIIHCTIDETEQPAEFVESIREFVTDWAQGISMALPLSYDTSDNFNESR